MNIDADGIEIRKNYIPDSRLALIEKEMKESNNEYPKHGIRNANKKFKSINDLANAKELIELASSILGEAVQLVRVIFFDKTADSNWLVTWHQDKTVATSSKQVIKGWGPWSLKDGINHVQPPLEVLERMLTFRLHLDDADENNGCLKVIPGSHKLGVLTQQEISQIIDSKKHVFCRVQRGDLVIMKPHILHSSNKSLNPGRRRVIHIEYSNFQLPDAIDWA